MPTPEEQRVLNQINNQEIERAGWTGFLIGILITSLLFIWLFIPIAQREAIYEFQQTQSYCEPNRGSV